MGLNEAEIASRYETARKLKVDQDEFCESAMNGKWGAIKGKKFPEDLQWESLVDILRGRDTAVYARGTVAR